MARTLLLRTAVLAAALVAAHAAGEGAAFGTRATCEYCAPDVFSAFHVDPSPGKGKKHSLRPPATPLPPPFPLPCPQSVRATARAITTISPHRPIAGPRSAPARIVASAHLAPPSLPGCLFPPLTPPPLAPSLKNTHHPETNTAYAELKPYAGQWDIAVATSATAGAPYEKDMCTEPAGCLPALGADQGSSLRITLTRVAAKNATAADGALSTLTGGAPVKLTLKACFSKPSTADRPWRRAAPVVDKDRSCPVSLAPPRQLTAAETAVGAPPLVFDFKVPKNAPKAAWYASAMLECADKQLCQHETTNGTAFWQTQAAQSRPASLIAAASVCSAVAPGMLALFFVRDHVLGRAKK